MLIPRLVIAGTQSGVGKTTITTGLLGALTKRNYRVQAFKSGPDYIDPTYHQLVTGLPSRNLDTYLLSPATLRELFERSAGQADLAVVEGVMGLFDGRDGQSEIGSTSYLAKILAAPVILVVDAGKMSRSAAATVYGYAHFDPQLPLAGVILNNVAGTRHYRWVKEAIEGAVAVPVLGFLPRQAELRLEERHLGLIPTQEMGDFAAYLERLNREVTKNIDLDQLLQVARSAPPWNSLQQDPGKKEKVRRIFPAIQVAPRCRLGVALDRSFHFYYQDNLDLLAALGAQIIPFSPLDDKELPSVDGLYIGGGFPEVFARQLAANSSLRRSLREAALAGLPLYAECGGLMYLTKSITTFSGETFPMTGVFPQRTVMTRSLQGMGYVEAQVKASTLFLRPGERLRGHLFHWSRLEGQWSQYAYELKKEPGGEGRPDGLVQGNTLASYLHLHFGSHPELAERFVRHCAEYRRQRQE
ncbi:MAG: cobyrinate a,c-diamide synthase [Firmicutes bacterium]|nr:cobyrinate a,c-diamide synthase [Bacillota bacterium]